MTKKAVIASWRVLAARSASAPGAMAGKPTIERIEIDETPRRLPHGGLRRPRDHTRAGQVIVRTFPGAAPDRPSCNDQHRPDRDCGRDNDPVPGRRRRPRRIEPDGTAILMIIGQVPFEFTGVLKIDLETGEAILEPQHTTEENLEKACAALTA